MKNHRFCLWLPFLIFAACSTDGALQQILGRNVEPPVFMECRPVSPREIVFKFTTPVKVVTLFFDTDLEVESVGEGSEILVCFSESPGEGVKITADILVEDADRNSLNVIVPFRSRNDRMPALVFNELRTEYSKPKVEFVEFLVPESGNLGAMRLFIAGHSLVKPAYEFPPAEVKAGEYIVLHLRTVEDGCVDETGEDLSLSGGTEAQTNARDFWLPGTAKMLRKTDALWLMDQDDRIIDAVLLSEASGPEWSSDKIAEAAEFLAIKKAWLPASGENTGALVPSDALISSGTTNTRTICRDESIPPKPRAANWYITATSSATPGKPNSTKRYN